MMEFKAWPKIPRVKDNAITISEKIDGTNGCLIIEGERLVGVQSRKRIITPDNDNFNFASWAFSNADSIAERLGDGYHYGEWAGPGIQKNHHNLEEKTLLLFNVTRWSGMDFGDLSIRSVPTLYVGPYSDGLFDRTMASLKMEAETAGYTPEGIIIYWHDTGSLQKMTFDNPEGKWAAKAA